MKKSVISATGLLAIIMVLTIASSAVGTTIQAQAKYIYNQHSHSDADNQGKGNDGSVTNCSGESCAASWGSEKYHINTNDNTNRPVDEGEESSNTNSHEMPNKGGNSGNSDNDDETEP